MCECCELLDNPSSISASYTPEKPPQRRHQEQRTTHRLYQTAILGQWPLWTSLGGSLSRYTPTMTANPLSRVKIICPSESYSLSTIELIPTGELDTRASPTKLDRPKTEKDFAACENSVHGKLEMSSTPESPSPIFPRAQLRASSRILSTTVKPSSEYLPTTSPSPIE